MAAISNDPPGTEYGPCKNACEHDDCAACREDVAALCELCHEEIGYERLFYVNRYVKPVTYKHFDCTLRAKATWLAPEKDQS